MADRLAEIEEDWGHRQSTSKGARADILWLIAEVKRLRRLEDGLRFEVDAYLSDLERLRAALQSIHEVANTVLSITRGELAAWPCRTGGGE